MKKIPIKVTTMLGATLLATGAAAQSPAPQAAKPAAEELEEIVI